MGDEGIKREMWEGKIPVCFKLDEDDITMTIRGDRVAPEPCYVSRICVEEGTVEYAISGDGTTCQLLSSGL